MTSDRWGGEQFDAFYRGSFATIVGSVRWIVGDVEVAREIAQDAFVAALVHWRKVSRYDNPGAWVRRVAIRDAVRAAKRARARPSFDSRAERTDSDTVIDVRAAIASLPAGAARRSRLVLPGRSPRVRSCAGARLFAGHGEDPPVEGAVPDVGDSARRGAGLMGLDDRMRNAMRSERDDVGRTSARRLRPRSCVSGRVGG